MTFFIHRITTGILSLGAVCLALGLTSQVSAATQQQLDEIAQRIQPEGIVCIEGQSCDNKRVKAVQVAANEAKATNTQKEASYTGRAPEKIYNRYCVACHTSGAAGAPRLGSAKEWQPHVAKGMDTMLKNAINGIGAMPPKGICSDCTDEELKHTIQFIIDNSQ